MKQKLTVKVMAEIGIFAALGFALDALQGGIFKGVFPNGGSIGVAMIPIFIIAYRRGLVPGLICGLILSLIQMLSGIYVIYCASFDNDFLRVCGPLIQVMLDYVLAYTVVGFAGAFSKKYQQSAEFKGKLTFILIGTIIGGSLKFLCHFLAGGFFWPGEMWGVTGWGYSAIYNGLYCLPNIVICTGLMVLLAKFYPQFLSPDVKEEE